MKKLFCVAVMVGLLMTGVAAAGLVQTDTGDTAPPEDTDFENRPVVLDRYNGAAPLDMVRLILKADTTGWMGAENLSKVSSTTATLNFKCNVELRKADTTLLLTANAGTTEVATLGAYDGVIDWAGTSGKKWDPVNATQTVTIDLLGVDMADFVGSGQITLYVSAFGASSASGGGNLVSIFADQQALATVTVEYYAEEGNIPEPGALVLLAGGLLGLVRRKRS